MTVLPRKKHNSLHVACGRWAAARESSAGASLSRPLVPWLCRGTHCPEAPASLGTFAANFNNLASLFDMGASGVEVGDEAEVLRTKGEGTESVLGQPLSNFRGIA